MTYEKEVKNYFRNENKATVTKRQTHEYVIVKILSFSCLSKERINIQNIVKSKIPRYRRNCLYS